MSRSRHYLLQQIEQEVTTVYSKPLFFPVKFQLPDAVLECMPASESRKYTGTKVMRFYTAPALGHTITYMERLWRIIDINHEPQVKGSTKVDSVPLVTAKLKTPWKR